MGQTRETRQNPNTVDSGDGRRSISWLQEFQASPAHPYDRNITKIKMLERQKQGFEKKGPQNFDFMMNAEVHNLEIYLGYF